MLNRGTDQALSSKPRLVPWRLLPLATGVSASFATFVACATSDSGAKLGQAAPAEPQGGAGSGGESAAGGSPPIVGSPNGAACSADTDCVSSFCSAQDGICCNAPCSDACMACSAAKTGADEGTCAPVIAGMDPDVECAAEGPGTCGVAGMGCNGDAQAPGCKLYGPETPCSEPACENGVLTPARGCNGSGICEQLDVVPCRPYTCAADGKSCGVSCQNDDGCSKGHRCADGTCEVTGEIGSGCMMGDQCTNGNCVDGVCCESACSGQCDTCAVDLGASEDGVCTPSPLGGQGVPLCNGESYCDGTRGDCALSCASSTLRRPPVDIVFLVDNSNSMGLKVTGLKNTINPNFRDVFEASGLDYRVVMFSKHGPAIRAEMCIEQPLSSLPAGSCGNFPPDVPGETERFGHFSYEVSTSDGLCLLVDRWDSPDEERQHLDGWRELLRPEAFKAFVVFSDDGVDCSEPGINLDDNNNAPDGTATAEAFRDALLGLSSEQFGTAQDLRFAFYSMVGMMQQESGATTAWLPDDPIATAGCEDVGDGIVDGPGTGYQALSTLTGGLRFPVCNPQVYGNQLTQIAEHIIAKTSIPCDLALPTTLPGTQINPASALLDFRLSPERPSTTLEQVPNVDACGSGKFFVNGEGITLCPQTCKEVNATATAVVEARYTCSE